MDNQTADTELTQKSEKSPTEKKARKRTDIRFYGKEGKKSAVNDPSRQEKKIMESISKLRTSTMADGILPNIKERLLAGDLIDKIDGKKAIVVPDERRSYNKPLQKSGIENLY